MWDGGEKKVAGASEGNEQQRQQVRERLGRRDATDFVIIDESGTNLNLTPHVARAPRGERADGSIPRTTPPNTTLIAAMTMGGMGPAMVLEGATDTAAFRMYLEQLLLPSLRAG
jgi:hypothetical protein